MPRPLLPGLVAGLALALAACSGSRVSDPIPAPLAAADRPTGFPAACAPGEVEVMLLGTYHFEGSNTDATSPGPHDVLAPERQAELEGLAARLARWAPDQVAVEWPLGYADSTTAQYRRYVAAGGVSSDPNEVVQVGFRLARRLGHPTVYPIDRQMPIGNDSIAVLLARRPDLQAREDSLLAVLQAGAERADAEPSVLARLRGANSEAGLRGGNSLGMFGAYLAAGEGENRGGPQLLARWYERNFYMAHHLTRVVRPGTRRVLVLIGSGHVPPLRAILDESPDFCPVSPLPYLG